MNVIVRFGRVPENAWASMSTMMREAVLSLAPGVLVLRVSVSENQDLFVGLAGQGANDVARSSVVDEFGFEMHSRSRSVGHSVFEEGNILLADADRRDVGVFTGRVDDAGHGPTIGADVHARRHLF